MAMTTVIMMTGISIRNNDTGSGLIASGTFSGVSDPCGSGGAGSRSAKLIGGISCHDDVVVVFNVFPPVPRVRLPQFPLEARHVLNHRP